MSLPSGTWYSDSRNWKKIVRDCEECYRSNYGWVNREPRSDFVSFSSLNEVFD